MDVVVVGSCVMDMISYASHLPKEGETITGTKFSTGFGGKGANQCVTAGKLGAKVAMVSKVGNDSNGKEYLKNLRDCNIACDYVSVIDDCATGVAMISVAENGSNCIIIVPGANHRLTQADVEAARGLIAKAKVLICQNEIPQAISVAAMKIAAENGVKIIYNPAPAEKDMLPELFSLPDYFCPNETEAELLTGCRVASVEDAKQACRVLVEDKGCQAVVMTLGERGAVFQCGSSPAQHVPTTAARAVDTTGAGDSFVGSFAFYLATKQLSMEEMIRRACAVASISVTKPGTQTSFPTAAEVPAELLM